jgi:hypothetical protein
MWRRKEGRPVLVGSIGGNGTKADAGGRMSVDAMHGPVRVESFLLLTAALSFVYCVDLSGGAITWRELCLWQLLKMAQGGLGSDMLLVVPQFITISHAEAPIKAQPFRFVTSYVVPCSARLTAHATLCI